MKALGKGSVASVVKVGLDVVRVLLWLAAIGLGVAVAASLALSVFGDAIFKAGAAPPLGGDGVTIAGVKADKLGWPILLSGVLAGVVMIAASLIVVGRLRKLFQKFTSNAPFDRENAGHLRVIWITMLAAEVSRSVITGVVLGLVTVFGEPDGVAITVDAPLNLSTWGAILILVVLAEVFAEGARLREEQDLTI